MTPRSSSPAALHPLALHLAAAGLALAPVIWPAAAQAQQAAPGDVAELPTVSVNASAITDDSTPQHLQAPVNGGALGTRTQLETPFSTTVVTQNDIKNAQPRKLGDLFVNDASVTDTSGGQHALAAYRGRTVILEWTNHECPYTVKHYATGNMQALQAAATGAGAIWLTVVSSRPGSQGFVGAAEADRLTARRNARPTGVVLDPTGQFGRLFGARTTPHMYIIDGAGLLVYMGAIDDRPTASHASVKGARN